MLENSWRLAHLTSFHIISSQEGSLTLFGMFKMGKPLPYYTLSEASSRMSVTSWFNISSCHALLFLHRTFTLYCRFRGGNVCKRFSILLYDFHWRQTKCSENICPTHKYTNSNFVFLFSLLKVLGHWLHSLCQTRDHRPIFDSFLRC